MPPGVENPSRKRAKNFLFDQTVHHQPSPWAPDFNSVGVTASQQTIQAFRSFDHLDPEFVLPDEQTLSSAAIDMLADSGIQWITIRKPLMNSQSVQNLTNALTKEEFEIMSDGEQLLILQYSGH